MSQLLLRVTLSAALAAALVLAGWSVRRPLVMMRQVGLHGWRPESGRRCQDPAGMPWRHCYGTTALSGGSRADDRVSLDRRTGRITELERVWRVSDSSEAIRQADSVARALAGHGGAPIACPPLSRTDSGVERIAAWRFPEQDVRMMRSRGIDPQTQGPAWVIQLWGVPVGYSGCQGPVRTRRLLTPTEMLDAVQRWLVEQAD